MQRDRVLRRRWDQQVVSRAPGPRRRRRAAIALAVVVTLCAAACSQDDDDSEAAASSAEQQAALIDHGAVGLWDDPPCDPSKPPLVVGTSTVFESPVLSLGDQSLALEAAATAFNERGGANGSCVEVHRCDDGANVDQSLECVRELDDAGVVALVNDQTTAGMAEVAQATADAGIPRVATNVTPSDWSFPNVFPLDAGSTGMALLMPRGLVEEGAKKIAIIRADLPEATALSGLLSDTYADQGATFPVTLPVPAGTTDYSQFILAAEDADATGAMLAVGEQEAVQVLQAAGQLDSDLLFSFAPLSHEAVSQLGDIAEQVAFVVPYPPATADVPVYEVMRADLADSGEEELQADRIRPAAIRSWIGLYALLRMIRDTPTTELTRDGITSMLEQAKDVPMLGLFGDEAWTPSLEHAGVFKRAGMNHWAVYRWDPDAAAPAGLRGNFVESVEFSFDEALCDSPLGPAC